MLSGQDQSVTSSVQVNNGGILSLQQQALEHQLIDRKAIRDHSQGSNNNNQNDTSILSLNNINSNNPYKQQQQREEKKSQHLLAPRNHLSRSPSDQSIEKTAAVGGMGGPNSEGQSTNPPRSLQPSQLGKNVILKP